MNIRRTWFPTFAALALLLAAFIAHKILRRDPPPPPGQHAPPTSPIRLHNITAETGIDFHHTDGSSGQRYIVETVASGMASLDFDNDGLLDLYFLNGCPLRGTPAPSTPPRNRLYRNLGGFRFQDVTEQADVGDRGFGLGVCAADYDNDGWTDIYVTNFGPNVLYRNNGDGTFANVTDSTQLSDGNRVGAGTAFLDADGDGCLDLYVANYVDFSYDKHTPEVTDGFPVYTGPRTYEPSRHSLYRNTGDGNFVDVTDASGIGQHPGPGMGLVAADYDDDGDTDLFVLNDVFGNFCWNNDGHGQFEEVSLVNSLKYNGDGVPMGSMGVDCADFNRDGQLDFFQTSYQGESPVLFQNMGGGSFEDVTRMTGVNVGGVDNVKWGCGFADFDNDGHQDIFYVNGHLQDNVELYDGATSYAGKPVLLRNLGTGRFENISDQAGDGLQIKTVGRGLALDDLDNDGRIDVAILASRRPAVLLRNESYAKGHWLDLWLSGVKSNRGGVGARVIVKAGDVRQVKEVHSGRGYQGHFGSRLHFGLGEEGRVDWVEVRWIGGGVDRWENLESDRSFKLIEGGQPPVCW